MQCFYVDSDGTTTDLPQWWKQSHEKLRKIQWSLKRMQLGYKNYRVTLQKLYQVHDHIANEDRDYIHKEFRRIANTWGAVCESG